MCIWLIPYLSYSDLIWNQLLFPCTTEIDSLTLFSSCDSFYPFVLHIEGWGLIANHDYYRFTLFVRVIICFINNCSLFPRTDGIGSILIMWSKQRHVREALQKENHWNYITSKNFGTEKKIVNRIKRLPTEWRRYLQITNAQKANV